MLIHLQHCLQCLYLLFGKSCASSPLCSSLRLGPEDILYMHMRVYMYTHKPASLISSLTFSAQTYWLPPLTQPELNPNWLINPSLLTSPEPFRENTAWECVRTFVCPNTNKRAHAEPVTVTIFSHTGIKRAIQLAPVQYVCWENNGCGAWHAKTWIQVTTILMKQLNCQVTHY